MRKNPHSVLESAQAVLDPTNGARIQHTLPPRSGRVWFNTSTKEKAHAVTAVVSGQNYKTDRIKYKILNSPKNPPIERF